MTQERFYEVLIIGLAVLIVFMVGILYGGQAFAQVQKFNAMEGRWETTYPESQLRFNAPEGEWSYVVPRGRDRESSDDRQDRRESYREVHPSFNAFEGRWEFPK